MKHRFFVFLMLILAFQVSAQQRAEVWYPYHAGYPQGGGS